MKLSIVLHSVMHRTEAQQDTACFKRPVLSGKSQPGHSNEWPKVDVMNCA